jgi:NADPH:quinone reductase-like Zn-dependent oxidoreductase
VTDHDVLIKIKAAGVNPLDYFTVSNATGIYPIPHIPGAEISGIVSNVGRHVTALHVLSKQYGRLRSQGSIWWYKEQWIWSRTI